MYYKILTIVKCGNMCTLKCLLSDGIQITNAEWIMFNVRWKIFELYSVSLYQEI